MLDVLDELEIKATFFVTGNNFGKGHIDNSSTPWPPILRRMYSAGHQIGSHTWTHRDLDQVNSTIQHTEMIYNEMAFRNLFGWIPTYMRPPYLDCTAEFGCTQLLSTLGYHIITENIDTKDYMYDDPQLIQNSKDRFSDAVSNDGTNHEYLILAHDVHYQTVVNLTRYMVETSLDRGYKLVTVGECLGDPVENWYREAGGASSPGTRTPPSTETTTLPITAPTETIMISRDQTCGGNSSYTCQGSHFGNCCSYYGYW